MTTAGDQGQGLEDFLVNMAEGLSEAQQKLSQSPVRNSMGEPAMTYHIPRMEFELKMEFTGTTGGSSGGLARAGKRFLFKPVSAATPSSESTSSVIKGVMVASPIEGGGPVPTLAVSIERNSKRKATVNVLGTDNLGNALAGAIVQIGIDQELSARLNRQEGRGNALLAGTRLEGAVIRLDDEGTGSMVLSIANREPDQQIIAIAVDLLSESETLLCRV